MIQKKKKKPAPPKQPKDLFVTIKESCNNLSPITFPSLAQAMVDARDDLDGYVGDEEDSVTIYKLLPVRRVTVKFQESIEDL